jgi:outer membrane protein assembly factor BamB
LGHLSAAETWPQWRGADGQGHASGSGLPQKWSETENIAWKTPVPGRGWSSPVVDEKVVWMTTAIETAANPAKAAERLKKNTSDQPLTLLEKVELRAVAVDRTTGKVVHDVELLTVADPQWVHQLNSYASPTPIMDGNRLFCHFGALGTACLDTTTAKLVWTNTEIQVNHENGPGSSPVIWEDQLIFHMDGSDAQFVAALDCKTGKLRWKTNRSGEMHANPQLKKSYGTPLILPVKGVPQLISPGSNWLYSYDATGKELWKLSYEILGFSLTPRPVSGSGLLFMSTGFMKPELLAVNCDAPKGPEVVWRTKKGVPTMPSPIHHGNEIYFVSDNGILSCLDAKTGSEHYRERLGAEFSASPTEAGGFLFLSDRSGMTSVVKAGPKFEIVAQNTISGKIMASLAAADGCWFLRSDTALYKIGK